MLWGCALWLEWRCRATMPPTSHIYSATDLFRDSHSSFMIISESDCLALLLCEREVNNTPTHVKNDRAGHPSSHLGINFKFPPWLPYGNCTPPTQHSPEEAPYTRRMIFPGHCTSSQNCLLIDQCQQQLRRSRWNISIWGNRFPTYYWWRDSFSRHPSTHFRESINGIRPIVRLRTDHRERVSDSYLLFHDCCNFEAIWPIPAASTFSWMTRIIRRRCPQSEEQV